MKRKVQIFGEWNYFTDEFYMIWKKKSSICLKLINTVFSKITTFG